VRTPVEALSDKKMAPPLSVLTKNWYLHLNVNILKQLINKLISFTAYNMATYSASVLERDTPFCALEPQKIGFSKDNSQIR
jgi:hypothetical protein